MPSARATGTTGPNLDTTRPDFSTVISCLETGPEDMPSFTGRLTPAQMRDVPKFVVATATGRQKPGGEAGSSG